MDPYLRYKGWLLGLGVAALSQNGGFAMVAGRKAGLATVQFFLFCHLGSSLWRGRVSHRGVVSLFFSSEGERTHFGSVTQGTVN